MPISSLAQQEHIFACRTKVFEILATVASDLHPDPNKAEGSLFVTLKSRNDINTLEDMKGKRLAATGPNGFAGHDLALGELAQRGQDPDHFFSSEIYTHYDMPARPDQTSE